MSYIKLEIHVKIKQKFPTQLIQLNLHLDLTVGDTEWHIGENFCYSLS